MCIHVYMYMYIHILVFSRRYPSTAGLFIALIVQLHWQKFCPVCGGNGVGSTAVAAGTATLR